jgi:hypothetical protein
MTYFFLAQLKLKMLNALSTSMHYLHFVNNVPYYLFDCVRVERGIELLLNEKYRKIKGNNCKKWHILYQRVKPVREKRIETGVWSSVKAEQTD